MSAFFLCIGLFSLWLLMGAALAAVVRPWKPLENLLLAPALGAAVTLLAVFTLNRAGLPVRSFGLSLLFVFVAASAVLLWKYRRVVPYRSYAPFFLVAVFSMALTGRPMFEFGFDWLSYCNDDMANYVLSAHRYADHGFFDPVDARTFLEQKSFPQLMWFFHRVMGVRHGSDLVLSWVIGITGLTGLQLFMPVILAWQGALITAGGALVYRNGTRRRAALITCALMSVSALVALGTLYQLFGQVLGLGLFLACATLLMPAFHRTGIRAVWRAGMLAAVPFSAFLVAYPELLPFLGLAVAIHLLLSVMDYRAAFPRMLIFVAVVASVVVILLNTFLGNAINFLILQGSGSIDNLRVTDIYFPYYLLPSGVANLFGILPTAFNIPEPFQSVAIAIGLVMLGLSVAAVLILVRRREPVAILLCIFAAVTVFFFYRYNDFALYKLAMFLQPFLWGCLGICTSYFLSRRKTDIKYRTGWKAAVTLGIILVGTNLFSHSYLVDRSRGGRAGQGGGFLEVQNASSSGLARELQRLCNEIRTPVIVMDTFNTVLAKFASLFGEGKSFITLTSRVEERFVADRRFLAKHEARKWFGRLPLETVEYANRLLDEFDRSTRTLGFDFKGPAGQISKFSRTRGQLFRGFAAEEATVLADSRVQTIINRRNMDSFRQGNVISLPYSEVENHLAFISSDLGQNYFLGDARFVSIYPPERDYMIPGETMSGIGRYLVLQALRPSERVRVLLEFSATLRGDGEAVLPPAAAVGNERVAIPFMGRGSARVFSDQLSTQKLEGQSFVGVDMGVDGAHFPSPRYGLMRLYGTSIPLDRRMLVGFARNLSLVSEDEYRSLRPPSSLSRFPKDLLHRDLEYSGIYEDGWVSESAFLRLSSGGARQVAVRGEVPALSAGARLQVSLLVNSKELLRQSLSNGPFELRAPWPPLPGRHHIELHFSGYQSLPSPDSRKVAARLNFVGFEDSQPATSDAPSVPDIVPSGSAISLGENWYPIENFNGERFRWVANDAAFTVSAGGSLNVEVEAGPGIGNPGFVLKVLDAAGATVVSVPVRGRQTVPLQLPSQPRKPNLFRFHVDGGGKRIPQDPRILNFRVFRLEPPAPPPAPRDIVCCGIVLGEGWHGLETFGGETFRWVGNNAHFSVPASSPRGIALEVEPGPGVGSKPFTLKISNSSGRLLHTFSVAGRRKVPVDLSPATYRLHLDGGGNPTPNDSRILNFRVFRIAAE